MTIHGPRCLCHFCLESRKRGSAKQKKSPKLKPLDLNAVPMEYRERIAKLFERAAT